MEHYCLQVIDDLGDGWLTIATSNDKGELLRKKAEKEKTAKGVSFRVVPIPSQENNARRY